MKIFNFTPEKVSETENIHHCHLDEKLFILCKTHEITALKPVFSFDESTLRDCTDLDESVRYSCFDGYDFISLVHIESQAHNLLLREINLYVAANYLVLVMPEHDSERLTVMEQKLTAYTHTLAAHSAPVNGLYFTIFHYLLSDFSDTLELLEDQMQDLSAEIVKQVQKEHFPLINHLHNMAYTAKKQLRSLSYLGDQILLDENRLIAKNHSQYFRNISTRLKKLYDFAENLSDLSSEMLYTFDSRMSIKTNDTINKLTVITLFFGPLTVITGIYGMNFVWMPELRQPWGYPLALAVMVLVSLILYFILKKKHWL